MVKLKETARFSPIGNILAIWFYIPSSTMSQYLASYNPETKRKIARRLAKIFMDLNQNPMNISAPAITAVAAAAPSNAVNIPAWTASGVLPPYIGGDPTNQAKCSPYETTLKEIVERFATNLPRIEILEGFLNFRESVSKLGFVNGAQWLDGSFLEDVETTEKRSPGDIDVVTITHRPNASKADADMEKIVKTNGNLFLPPQSKKTYKCDAYWIDLDTTAENIVQLTHYWYGLFSHRRNGLWKGMLRVPLHLSADDAQAKALLGTKKIALTGAANGA